MTRAVFESTMDGLIEYFDAKLSVRALALWWEDFKDWTDAEFVAAAKRARRECRFMPKYVDLAERRPSPPDPLIEAIKAHGNKPWLPD